ncbi:MAG: hypothetical protein Q8P67_05815, partial [archaeon]|nr:hypothetical protein [archaeon]
MTALLWSLLAIHCVLSSHRVLSREPKPHRLLSPLAASHGASSSEEGALRMTGKAPGTCVAWAEPAVSFYCGSFSIELVYRTAVDAEREGPSGEMLALLSNLRVDNAQERASQNYGRHFQVLLDDRPGAEGAVMVQWLSRHWGAEGFVRSAKGIIDGRFHRVEVHRDAEAGTVELVVDGESVAAQLQAGVDLETQDQVTVIGGCFAGRYRTGDLGFLRLHTKQRELGGLLFQESDAVFSGASSFLMDGSPAANDFWWIGHPLLPKFVAEPLIRGHLPLCADGPHQPIGKDCWWDNHILNHSRNQNQPQGHLHNHSLQSPALSSQPHVNRQHVVLSALLSSGGGSGTPSQDQDDFFAVPFYFLSFA